MLHDLLVKQRERILSAAHEQAAKRTGSEQLQPELRDGLPVFLDQLVGTLASADRTIDMAAGATVHGGELRKQGLSVGQVVHAYGDLCQAVTEIAAEDGQQISAADFGTFNRCLDDAIGHAVTEYARLRDRDVSDLETERLGCLAHELRNLLNSGTLAFEAIKSGRVGAGGSTGAVLSRSLIGLRNLVDRSIAEVRMEAGLARNERIQIDELVEDVEVGAAVEASEKGVLLTILPVDRVVVDADRQLLTSAVINVLQNAIKFSPKDGTVTLTVKTSKKRVQIEVADACGGLPPGSMEKFFLPFQQGGSDRSGLGLGLTIARRAIRVCDGDIRVADVPGAGCVVTIDLPAAGLAAA